jgi:hypothetical protein
VVRWRFRWVKDRKCLDKTSYVISKQNEGDIQAIETYAEEKVKKIYVTI